MPKEKKRNPGRNKKKIKTVKKQPSILEYAGYELGQEVWVRTDPYGTEEWAYGSILEFYPTDRVEPSFSFFDKVRKRFAVGAISKIEVVPPKRWLTKAK